MELPGSSTVRQRALEQDTEPDEFERYSGQQKIQGLHINEVHLSIRSECWEFILHIDTPASWAVFMTEAPAMHF